MTAASTVIDTIRRRPGARVPRGEFVVARGFAGDYLNWRTGRSVAGRLPDAQLLFDFCLAIDLDIVCIHIAGAFGYHLNEESLRQTGIIPRAFKSKIEFAGNTCRTGCALLLMDATTRQYIESRMKRVTHLSFAGNDDFLSRFINNIALGG